MQSKTPASATPPTVWIFRAAGVPSHRGVLRAQDDSPRPYVVQLDWGAIVRAGFVSFEPISKFDEE